MSGKYKGYSFKPFKAPHTRPTTDIAKEAIFNSIVSRYDIEDITVLDLFAGTGSMSLEFLSRGALKVTSADYHEKNLKYLLDIKKELSVENWKVEKSEVLEFLKYNKESFDLIFADPPYDWNGFHALSKLIPESDTLKEGGCFILEHPKTFNFTGAHVLMSKQYGISCFTFFAKQGVTEN
ncbi:MAG: RsmD family RNA methyltransferase [Bacteroidia bacterium]|nr:RsmD family RNA methyltransferase [Bacteroidia bacterium]